ncbi:hypothetical protein A1353_23325 [Methylomonas methanica]|uniref:Uncharacterized protein n=1 Tax=Methylomonas methanica TaxID=421 RepID=A0A177LUT0_METMH|nr:hypothetical protein [Methylomonas methanica]OAH97225.1 hypothetical protein A1353_23325 [Methylomonas methanica]
MDILKLSYLIGVYDPANDDTWPWHFQYEYGQYLSAKHRVCGRARAAEFATEKEARDFYFLWKHARAFKFELIPVQYWVTGPDPVYPPEHPRSILRAILAHEPHPVRVTASFWFYDQDISTLYSGKTLKKHREALLKYGIDIDQPRPEHLEIKPEQPVIQEPEKRVLTLIK